MPKIMKVGDDGQLMELDLTPGKKKRNRTRGSYFIALADPNHHWSKIGPRVDRAMRKCHREWVTWTWAKLYDVYNYEYFHGIIVEFERPKSTEHNEENDLRKPLDIVLERIKEQYDHDPEDENPSSGRRHAPIKWTIPLNRTFAHIFGMKDMWSFKTLWRVVEKAGYDLDNVTEDDYSDFHRVALELNVNVKLYKVAVDDESENADDN